MNETMNTGMTRRSMLKRIAVASLGTAIPRSIFASPGDTADWRSAVTNYLEKHALPDGGYGWEDQERSHLTPTFATIGAYGVLKQSPPRKDILAEYVLKHHPAQLKKLEQEHREFEFQQIQSLIWLGESVTSFRDQVTSWRSPAVYLKQYEQQSNPILRHEVTAFTCRKLLDLPLDGLDEYTKFLMARRRSNGSFNNTPAADESDGHVVNTLWGLQALETLGKLDELKTETVAWLRSCQLQGGGFTWTHQPAFAGTDDVSFTWAAVRALQLLGSKPAQPAACAAYLRSLRNADGGFGDRPGQRSNLMATYQALDALAHLGELDSLAATKPTPPPRPASLPASLRIFSIQIEAHGHGSPADAVELARTLRIHLWGAKNASPEWLARAQGIAEEHNVPVKFFASNEEYGTWVKVPGLGTYSHTSDVIAPAGTEFGPSLANKGIVSWQEFRDQRLTPLQRAEGRLIWQFGENEELVRLFLNDSVERGGFAAISTFHFGNPDFTNSEPFLERYRGEIPFVALQDAHGEEPWWFADKTAGFRTVFLGTEPTWEAWLKALKMNWVVAIRRDGFSGGQTWMHSGSREVLDFIRARELDWRWWNNPAIRRPMASLVALTPRDVLEIGCPKEGVALRVRCAWECAAHGQLKNPMAELLKLSVDGAEVSTELVTSKAPRGGALTDRYHHFTLPHPAPGKHTAEATVRVLETGAESTVSIGFIV